MQDTQRRHTSRPRHLGSSPVSRRQVAQANTPSLRSSSRSSCSSSNAEEAYGEEEEIYVKRPTKLEIVRDTRKVHFGVRPETPETPETLFTLCYRLPTGATSVLRFLRAKNYTNSYWRNHCWRRAVGDVNQRVVRKH